MITTCRDERAVKFADALAKTAGLSQTALH
jgi:hypothetical protein